MQTKNPVLLLHIGTPKTGTSALQTCLAKNRNFLTQNKICYSEFHESNNFHLNLTLALIKEYFDKNGVQNGAPVDIPVGSIPISQVLYSRTPADIVNSMKRAFYENGCDRLVISDECLFESTIWWIFPRSVNTEKLLTGRRNYIMNYFKEAFKEFDIKIVCYLRRQDDYIESLYNQWCKGMDAQIYDVVFNSPPTESQAAKKYKISENNAPNIHMAKFINGMFDAGYYSFLSGWSEIYGKENISVRIYEKSRLPKGIEYDFFTNILGFGDNSLAGIELYEEVNAGFKKDIIEYRNAAKILDMQGEFYALNDSPALERLAKNNKKNILTARQAEEILEYYGGENTKIAREYLHRDDGVLFRDKKRGEKDDYPGLSTEAAVDISRELILMLKNRK